MIPGVNPIKFSNLEEYAEYVKWGQKVGLKCPILYFEQTYDAQNNRKKIRFPYTTQKNSLKTLCVFFS